MNESISESRTVESSDNISVKLYHQTLICPVQLHLTKEINKSKSPLEEIANQLISEKGWRKSAHYFPQDDPFSSQSIGMTDRDYAYSQIRYSEYVYFHPFVREFLYPNKRKSQKTSPTDHDALNILKRDDIKWVLVTFQKPGDKGKSNQVCYMLRVRRCEFYLFEAGAGMFVIEFDSRQGPHAADYSAFDKEHAPFDIGLGKEQEQIINWDMVKEKNAQSNCQSLFTGSQTDLKNDIFLKDVLLLQDSLRRSYAPYWNNDLQQSNSSAGHCVKEMIWLDKNLKELPSQQSLGQHSLGCVETIDSVRDKCHPQLFPWWERLLQPLDIINKSAIPQKPSHVTASLLGDDRMGVMTYLAISNTDKSGPRRISQADWMRLAFQDDPGHSERYPYSKMFWGETTQEAEREFTRQHAYDRHFDPTGDKPSNEYMHTTRFLFSDLGFVAVTPFEVYTKKLTIDNSEKSIVLPRFGIDSLNGILAHFRYHYFKIGLVVHFQRSFLLILEQKLADAVAEYQVSVDANHSKENFRKQVRELSKCFLKFRCRYWFTEISSQTQAEEFYERWRKQLRSEDLFNQVSQELNEAEQLLTLINEEDEIKNTKRISKIGLWFLPVALLAPLIKDYFHAGETPIQFLLTTGVFCLSAIGVILWGRTETAKSEDSTVGIVSAIGVILRGITDWLHQKLRKTPIWLREILLVFLLTSIAWFIFYVIIPCSACIQNESINSEEEVRQTKNKYSESTPPRKPVIAPQP